MMIPDKEKNALFSILAYGVHSTFNKDLERKIKHDFETKSIFFYESFLQTPYIRGMRDGTSILDTSPFLLRVLNQQNFIPKFDENLASWEKVEFLPFKFDKLCEFWQSEGSFLLSETEILSRIFKSWQEKTGEEKDEDSWIEYDAETNIVTGNFQYPLEHLRREYLNEIRGKRSYKALLKEYLITIYPWLLCRGIEKLNVACMSISSHYIFYGTVFIYHVLQDGDVFRDKNKKETDLVRWLKEIIRDTYAPVLLFFENYWEEACLDAELQEINQGKKPDWSKYILRNELLIESEDNFEKAFHLIWRAREKSYNFLPHKPIEATKEVEKSLLLKKYFIASPSMIKTMKTIALPREEQEDTEGTKKEKKSEGPDHLPCILVSGAPGSGKDKLAQIAQLFFPKYRFGKRYTINMAALKPEFLSVPLMSGFEGNIEFGKGKMSIDIDSKIKGIFLKIWEEHTKTYRDEAGLKRARDIGVMPVVILDELNSLDIDAQGSLLRVLENAKLQPLGRPGEIEEKVDFLIVATVNEPSDLLTFEKPLRKLLEEKELLGEIPGKALYEYFRNMRRLRDDLYYRLVRDGQIEISNLGNRRQDIPILFSHFVKEELTNLITKEIQWSQLWFDLDVYEELMDERLPWSGNFRQLESLAKRVAMSVTQDKKNKVGIDKIKNGKEPDLPVHISINHLERYAEGLLK